MKVVGGRQLSLCPRIRALSETAQKQDGHRGYGLQTPIYVTVIEQTNRTKCTGDIQLVPEQILDENGRVVEADLVYRLASVDSD
jgi:hypothetical protein